MQDNTTATRNDEQSRPASHAFASIVPDKDVVEALAAKGFTQPTLIQSQVIPLILAGKDIVVQQAETGAGNTTAYAIPLLSHKGSGNLQAVIVTGSDEQVERIVGELSKLGIGAQQASAGEASAKTDALVGTAESLAAALESNATGLRKADKVILDSIDQVVSPGSDNPVYAFIANLSSDGKARHFTLVSKAMPVGVYSLIKKFFKSPEYVEVSSESSAERKISHQYCEILGDVLSKPNALCDLLETAGGQSCAIFCNAPSDADLVDAILRKRGIGSRKLIGHVPTAKVDAAMDQLRKGEISAVVFTDVAAKDFDAGKVDLIVNYSVPNDPDIYLDRIGHQDKAGRLKKVISLVTPLDLPSLHYLKKVVESKLVRIELPSKEDLFIVKVKNLSSQALNNPVRNDERVKRLVSLVLADENREAIVALLLHNTLDVLPGLQNQPSRERERGEDRGDRRDRGDRDRGDRGGDDRYESRDRDRGGRRRGRGRDRHEDGGSWDQGDESHDDQREDRRERRSDRRDRGERGDRGERSERDEGRGRQRRHAPPIKDTRVYIGQGARDGFSEAKFLEILQASCDAPKESVKRFSLRERYSFVDLAEENAESILEKLQAGEGEKLFMKKAITITSAREEEHSEEGEELDAQIPREDEEGDAPIDSEMEHYS